MSDNLVFIVKTRQENANTLLRRVYLSGWNTRKGFFEALAPDELPQVKDVPSKKTEYPHPDYFLRAPTEQEYFIVNFDPSSLIAMDYPVAVTPYRIWDTASFNGAYAVTSESTGFMPFELFESVAPIGGSSNRMTNSTFAFYTAIDDETKAKLQPLATGIISDIPGYYDRILALTSYLHDGDFRYSLKPGTAPDGDQLSWFLFNSKKGYCTYFAFSLCLMLRSVGIPSRVAAGFFIQGDSGELDYYPIRANMAHAWVEVFFPKYGWISFDPTTTRLAEGEDLEFSTSPGGDEFMALLNEIIDKRGLLSEENGPEASSSDGFSIIRIFSSVLGHLQKRKAIFFFSMILLAMGIGICVLRAHTVPQTPRARILHDASRMYRHLRFAGKKRLKGQTRRDFVKTLADPSITELFGLEQKARFAEYCTAKDAQQADKILLSIIHKYRRHHTGKSAYVLFFFLLASGIPAKAENGAAVPPAPEMLAEAQTALSAENWELAIRILNQAKSSYPFNPEFPFTLGTLYLDKNLYAPARKELLTALELGYQEAEIYSKLADSSSFLNEDEAALRYLRAYLDKVPDDLFAWSNFGWLCYKTHRLEEGIAALHRVTETYGPDGNLYVGLGNLYTATFNYTDAKKYYTLAINMSLERKQAYLSSIYFYNRSILEEVFYHFQEAYDDTERSLEQTPRATGYLMQGELDLRKLEYTAAVTNYLKAYNLDSTPLATLGLADTLCQAGYPEEALRYITSIQDKKDLSWIANYGTTIDQYLADIQKMQKDIYQLLLHTTKRKIVHNFSTFVSTRYEFVRYSLAFWYHDTMQRIQNTRVARQYSNATKRSPVLQTQDLYINSFYFNAFDKWQPIAMPYLLRAEAIENEFIPEAKPSYMYQKAITLKDVRMLDSAIESLDPLWEKQDLSKALAKRIQLTPNSARDAKQELIERLYELNPPALTFHDIKLPVTIISDTDQAIFPRKDFAQIQAYLLTSGFSKEQEASFIVKVFFSTNAISVTLSKKDNKTTICAQIINKNANYHKQIPDIINSFSTRVFTSNLNLQGISASSTQ